jgi:hypothetical protein
LCCYYIYHIPDWSQPGQIPFYYTIIRKWKQTPFAHLGLSLTHCAERPRPVARCLTHAQTLISTLV